MEFENQTTITNNTCGRIAKIALSSRRGSTARKVIILVSSCILLLCGLLALFFSWSISYCVFCFVAGGFFLYWSLGGQKHVFECQLTQNPLNFEPRSYRMNEQQLIVATNHTYSVSDWCVLEKWLEDDRYFYVKRKYANSFFAIDKTAFTKGSENDCRQLLVHVLGSGIWLPS